MRTEELIQSLSAQTRPVSAHAVEQRLSLGLVAGGAVTLALVITTMGLRPDLPGAMMNARFLMKAAYTFRRLAPTNLRAAGAVAGLAAGAFGATLYGLHCPEVSASFVVTWYSLGIAIPTAIGAIFGPQLLRW